MSREPSWRRWSRVSGRLTLYAGFVFLVAYGLGIAQDQPVGQPVLNQGREARLLTKSDTTVIKPTRGLHIGDGSACNIAVRFNGDSAAVTLPNVQPGLPYPYSIIQLMSTGTNCTSVTALY